MDAVEVARKVVAGYGRGGGVRAALVAGSLGRGTADHYSDIEIDVYWEHPPTDERRSAAVAAVGGDLTTLWPYEPDEGEWSEDFEVAGHEVTISGFAVPWLEDVIADRSTFDLLGQLRLAALHEGFPLLGEETVQHWRDISSYPDELGGDTVTHYLTAAPLGSWRQWPALVERHDSVPLHDLCTQLISSMVGMLCGLNHVYVSHPRFKWTAQTIKRFSLAPDDLQTRLSAALQGRGEVLAGAVNDLYRETLLVVESVQPSEQVAEALAGLHSNRR